MLASTISDRYHREDPEGGGQAVEDAVGVVDREADGVVVVHVVLL
jgi:hypothetical protein